MLAILGAGAIGRLWAATLPAGQVAFVPRPGPASEPVRFRFVPHDGSAVDISIPWLQPGQQPELVLVTTKAGATVAALSTLLPTLPAAVPVVLFQNGLGSQQQVTQRWPERPVLAASTTEGANRPAPDITVHAGRGETWVGALTNTGNQQLDTVVEQLKRSGLVTHPEPDITGKLWQKLIVNAGINPFTAILDCNNGDILIHPFYQRWIAPLCQEISQLLPASGQPARSADALRAHIERVARSTAANTSSMRADRLAGRPTEIDYINGYLVKLGKQYAIPTPVNQMLIEQVHQLS